MALITCQKCGKKFSDSVSFCIHCGHDPKIELTAEEILEAQATVKTASQEELQTAVAHDTQAQEEIASPTENVSTECADAEEESDQAVELTDFFSIGLKAAKAYKEEFWATNPQALNFQKKVNVLFEISWSFVIFGLVSFLAPLVMFMVSFHINNYALILPFLLSCVAIFVVSVIGAITFFVLTGVYRNNKKNQLHEKAFNQWLRETKHVRKED